VNSEQGRGAPPRPTLVVCGNGMVAHRLRTRLAMAEPRFHLVLLGEEPRPAYDRVHLTECLLGRSPETLELQVPEGSESAVEVHLGDAVVNIDRTSRRVRTASGREFAYDRLVLATGSRAAMPPIPGLGRENVFTYRSLEDLGRIRARAGRSRTAAVIGGGLLGLEAARALAQLGLEVHVVEQATHLLQLQLDEAGAAVLRQRVEGRGLRIHLARRTRGVGLTPGGELALEFEDGGTLPVDMVLVAVGIVPNDELARSCGLACAAGGGVEVDGRMRTEDPLISAVGECASVLGRTYGLVAPAFEMVNVLVSDLAGRSANFLAPAHATRLRLVEADVGVVGDRLGSAPGLRSVRWRSGEDYRELVLRGRRLVGAAGVGRWPDLERVQEAVREGRPLRPWELLRFRLRGRVWSAENQRDAHELPQCATVCACLGVTRAELSRALERGARDVPDLTRATGAGSVCGSCDPALSQLVDPRARPTAPSLSPALLTLSSIAIAASVTLIAIAAAGGLEASSSWQEPRALEFLWRTGSLQQVTGFLVVALVAGSLTISLRKRWRLVRLGGRAKWRVLHASAALASLCVLALHTGLDPGGHLLAVLYACALAVFLSGGLLGVLFGFRELRPGSAAWRLRGWLWWLHIAALWPLPVLCFFHLLAVYRF
jgi:NAD(P)H-nitrite reductase large subunit